MEAELKIQHGFLALNACSLILALIANIALLFNFARRIRYLLAQPLTITLWYLACILLVIPLGLSRNKNVDPQPEGTIYSQSYYYGLISAVLYFTISTLLLISTLGAVVFHAYEPSFNVLTGPQRTLMLQTISFTLYLALGAGVFSSIEGWGFVDGLYWADYTLLTIGLGTDFPITRTASRMLLIPYAAFGITLIGLVVSSIRGLVLERAKTKVMRRHLGKQREKWKQKIARRRQVVLDERVSTASTITAISKEKKSMSLKDKWLNKKKEVTLGGLPLQVRKHVPNIPLKNPGRWNRAEFELMRFIETHTETLERYTALGISFLAILIVWIGGALVFWKCEHKSQGWTFVESFYFTYTTLLTIGYGDFYPSTAAGKPFFVFWSLISVPAMTILISNMGNTVVKWVQDVTILASKWTILPERSHENAAHMGPKSNKSKRKNQTKTSSLRPNLDSNSGSSYHGVNGTTSQPSSTTARNEDTPDVEEGGQENGTNQNGVLQRDVEQLGLNVKHFEEGEGRQGSLAARIAKEISMLAKDLGQKPPKKYTWDEWIRWLDMLGEREPHAGSDELTDDEDNENGQGTHINESMNEIMRTSSTSDHSEPRKRQERSDSRLHHGEIDDDRLNQTPEVPNTSPDEGNEGVKYDWHWSWLSDRGPLFSHLTETEWVIEKLCFRLEEVLEDEITAARGENKKNR